MVFYSFFLDTWTMLWTYGTINGAGYLAVLAAAVPYTILYSVSNIIFLLLGGMPLFDAVCTAFGTAGTGGFGVRGDSIAGYSTFLQNVITVFMLLFGVNFTFYYLLLQKKWKDICQIKLKKAEQT